jgi:choline dehydrogenase
MTFDFVIVGAGSAGCVLAERLTASGKHSVAVVEAGGSDNHLYIRMPLGYGKTFYDPTVNWMYAAEPDPGLNGQRDHWPRGKVLGGSSSINAMVYIRGPREDYEEWERLGNRGWGWSDALRCFMAIEDTEAGGDEYRGVGGPLFISKNDDQLHPLYQAYVEACRQAGLPYNPDFNGASQEGTGHYQLTVQAGERNSAARAFLRPAMQRRNLHLISEAFVHRLLFDGRRCIGVAYMQGGQMKELRTNREVIVSAGAVNSPQLLQLSGLGAGRLLQDHGIKLVNELPHVGQNLQDHVGLNYTYRMKQPTLNDELRPLTGKLLSGLRYMLQRRGPLSLSINQGGGFFRTSAAHKLPNMQLYMQAFSTLLPKAGERPLTNPDPFSGFSIGLSNCRPTSRGSIEIRSPDAAVHPRIVANAYGTPEDVQEMLEAVKFIRKIAAQPALAPLIAEELRPGPAVKTDEELIHDFRQRSGTVYHASCTCRMASTPAEGVVDARLRVHGVDGLRVCDASVFPKLISGNTNAACLMVGWRGAELIGEDAL